LIVDLLCPGHNNKTNTYSSIIKVSYSCINEDRERQEKKKKNTLRETYNVHVRCGGANVLMEFVSVGEHDKRDLSITKNSEFLGFLENTISSF
jgi:hypothetical protein